jgi:ESCRT-II complex subunit VPS22
LAGLKLQQKKREQFTSVGRKLDESEVDYMARSLAAFKDALEKFAVKHKKDINRDPTFRRQFAQMCAKCGVDPLASNQVG